MENGTAAIFQRTCYGYEHDEHGHLSVKRSEADIVQKIYHLYLDGQSILGIKRTLESEGIPSPTGKKSWCKKSIENILSNEKYTGDVIVFKTYNEGFPQTKRHKNSDGIKHERYLSESNNPAIITKEVFEAVQQEKLRRSNVEKNGNGIVRKSTRFSSVKHAE